MANFLYCFFFVLYEKQPIFRLFSCQSIIIIMKLGNSFIFFFFKSIRSVKCRIGTSPTVSNFTPREATTSSKVCIYIYNISYPLLPSGCIACMRKLHRARQKGQRIYNSKLTVLFRLIIKACKTDSEGKVVEGKHTVYRMSAAEQAEKDEWIACIR